MVQILNGIWLGSTSDVMNINFCLSRNIKAVIYCTDSPEENYPDFMKHNIEFIKINISTFEKSFYTKYNDELFDYMSDVIKFMYKKYVNFKGILLACPDGSQISPALMCAFLMNYGNMNVENAIDSVKSKGDKFFYDNCVHALNKFYYRLHNQ
jgi:protein-tyrosine phosphatase